MNEREKRAVSSSEKLRAVAAVQYGLVTRAQILELGLSPSAIAHRLRAGSLAQALPGVYRLGGTPRSWHQDLLAACYWSDGFASHRAAAALWKFEGFVPGLIEVTSHRRLSAGSVICHRTTLHRVDVTAVDGIPVTQPWRTLLDLAAVCPPRKVDSTIDYARRRGLVTPERLQWMLDRIGSQGRNGAGVLRELLQLRLQDGGTTDSRLERKALRELRAARFPVPVTQHPVSYRGRTFYIDLAYPNEMIAIELDGRAYHSDGADFQRDHDKHNAMVKLGYMPLRFTYADVFRRTRKFLVDVREALIARGYKF